MSLFSYLKQTAKLFKKQNIAKIHHSQQYDIFHYKSTVYLSSPFVQTIYGIAEKQIPIKFEREKIFFEDGGHVALDWGKKITDQRTPPILFIMHGLTGGSEKNYIRALIELASQEGYQCVCLNSRGVNTQMTSPLPFIGIEHEELDAAIRRVEQCYPFSSIYLVGASFGGNYLIRYLINKKRSSIKGLVALAPPFNIKQVIDEMPPMYQKFFVRNYINNSVVKHPQMEYWQKIGLVNRKQVLGSKNLRQFYSSLTLKILGYNSVDYFFEKYTINGQMIGNLDIDTLLIVAKDDPIVSYKAMPHQQIKANKKIKYVVTEHGSHLCWFEGLIPKRWYPKAILNYLKILRKTN